MSRLILLRHGQSVWNRENRFTGSVDIPLSKQGVGEAKSVGLILANTPIDVIFSSALFRAIETACLIMTEHLLGKNCCICHSLETQLSEEMIPLYPAKELNERCYGELQGKNKQEIANIYGATQVHSWRRGFNVRPPGGESLFDTTQRVLPFFYREIEPYLIRQKHVLISAHGNSLRAMIMGIEKISEEEIVDLELKTGQLWIYEYQKGKYERISLF